VTTRREATAAVLEAQQLFRRRAALLPKWTRRALARATRELARVMKPLCQPEGLALEELADLVDVVIVPVPASSLPPDNEGDEELLAKRGRMRQGWRDAP